MGAGILFVKVTCRFQVTISQEVREEVGLNIGDIVMPDM